MASPRKPAALFIVTLLVFSLVIVSTKAEVETTEAFGSLNPFNKGPGDHKLMPPSLKEVVNTERVGHLNPFKKGPTLTEQGTVE
ncbi:hypothetical protein AgCh_000266 [Apium graveolens]